MKIPSCSGRRKEYYCKNVEYKPCEEIKFADATPRHPISSYDELATLSLKSPDDHQETMYVAKQMNSLPSHGIESKRRH